MRVQDFYFITLVTQNRECIMGRNNRWTNGIIRFWKDCANFEWLKSFEIRQKLFWMNISSCPIHLHAIVVLQKTDEKNTHDSGNVDGPFIGTILVNVDNNIDDVVNIDRGAMTVRPSIHIINNVNITTTHRNN